MFSSSLTPAALLLALGLAPGTVRADAPGGAASCQPSEGSLALLGCTLSQRLLPAAAGAPVTIVELKSDRELPAPDALRERVKQEVQSALGKSAPRSKLGVELRIEKKAGVLRVSAELRRSTGLWQRARHKKPSAELTAFAEAPLDAELRALIPPPPLVVSETLKLRAPERGIVAVACGPLGSEGGQELALVSRSHVRVGRIAGRAFVERKKVAWSALSPVAPAPLREPIASAEITGHGTLRLGLSDRRDGLVLSRELEVLERFDGSLPVPGGSCVARVGVGLEAAPSHCLARTRLPLAQPLLLDAIAGTTGDWFGRDQLKGQLTGSRAGLARAARALGAQLASGDADSDGNPELVYSEDTNEASKDRVTLVTVSGEELAQRFELAAPGISALAICARREGPGMAPIVVASGEELWLLR